MEKVEQNNQAPEQPEAAQPVEAASTKSFQDVYDFSSSKTLSSKDESAEQGDSMKLNDKTAMSPSEEAARELRGLVTKASQVSDPEVGLRSQEMGPNGKSSFQYDSSQRPDGLKQADRVQLGDGGSDSLRQYEGRKDGLLQERIVSQNGFNHTEKNFDPSERKDGQTFSMSLKSQDGTVNLELNNFDPDKRSDRLASESIAKESGVETVSRSFDGRADGLRVETSQTDPTGRLVTRDYADGSKSMTHSTADGVINETKKYDATGKLVSPEAKALDVTAKELNGAPKLTDAQIKADVTTLKSGPGRAQKSVDVLENKTEGQREQLDKAYRQETGKDLRSLADTMEGSDKAKFLAALDRKDNDPVSNAADRIHVALAERDEWRVTSGRSNFEIDKDLRDVSRRFTADQWKQLDQSYLSKHGITAQQAIRENPNVAQATKDSVDIYAKGSNERTDGDSAKLVDIALKQGSTSRLDFFKEAVQGSSPEFRKQFLENGGQKRLQESLGSSPRDLAHARDYLGQGRLDVATQVRENTGFSRLTSNYDGVELAVNGLTPEKKSDYQIGKFLNGDREQLSTQDKERLDTLSPLDKERAKMFYSQTHQALKDASSGHSVNGNLGNDTAVAKWEAQIAHPGNSFVSSFEQNRGTFYNSSTTDIVRQVEQIGQKDWEYAKAHPEQREDFAKMLGTLNKSPEDVKKILGVYDAKTGDNVKTYEESKGVGQRGISESLRDDTHFYGNDKRAGLESLRNLSTKEQQQYRDDPKFKERVDRDVKVFFGEGSTLREGGSLQEARRILESHSRGEKPTNDVLSQLRTLGADGPKDSGTVFGAVKDAFKQDPALRERIVNPSNPADKQYSQDFHRALKESVGRRDYQLIGKDYVENGGLTVPQVKELNERGSGNRETYLKHLALVSPAERERLGDKQYADSQFKGLPAEQRKIAENVARQGEFKPEDGIYSSLHTQGGHRTLVQKLKDIPEKDLDTVRKDYSEKYGKSLDSDVLGKLTGAERGEASNLLANNVPAHEKLERQLRSASETRSGVGSWLTEQKILGSSATGGQLDDVRNGIVQKLADSNKGGEPLTDKQLVELADQQQKATKNHIRTKESVGENVAAVGSGLILAGSGIVTGGGTWALAATAGAGGLWTVGSKATLGGANYDRDGRSVAWDFVKGGANTFGIGKGGQILARESHLGRQAAKGLSKDIADNPGTKGLVKEAFSPDNEKALEGLARKSIMQDKPFSHPHLNKEFKKAIDAVIDPAVKGTAREGQAVEKIGDALTKYGAEQLAKKSFTNKILSDSTRLIAANGTMTGVGAAEGLNKYEEDESLLSHSSKVLSGAGKGFLQIPLGPIAGRSTLRVSQVAQDAGSKGLKSLGEQLRRLPEHSVTHPMFP